MHDSPPLSPSDAEALDAIVAAGFDPDAVPAEHRERARRIAALLEPMNDRPGELEHTDGTLTARVIESIRAATEQALRLSTRDDEALESCVMNGFDTSRVPPAVRPRAERHEALRRAVTTLSPEHEQWIAAGRHVRTQAVLDAVRQPSPIPFEEPAPAPRGFRFADLLAAAAVLLIAAGLMLPVKNSMTESSRRAVCMSNLQAAGLGLGLYAMSNDEALPMATAGFGGSWSRVGDPRHSQSANLYTLVRTKHVAPWMLTCPGNPAAPSEPLDEQAMDWRTLDEVSYSYRLMPAGQNRIDRLDGDSVVLADRSPILLAALRGQRISPETSSPNHRREGQHLLRLDDSVRWSPTPVLENGDNIWLPRAIERFVHDARLKRGLIDGYELPEDTEDTFLGP
ncbi:MAG TPA: hypothetical protein ENK11_00560 [Phycisphaerales bacterium]|nr:hypothetical protein [Phycisphaerales bacterium]